MRWNVLLTYVPRIPDRINPIHREYNRRRRKKKKCTYEIQSSRTIGTKKCSSSSTWNGFTKAKDPKRSKYNLVKKRTTKPSGREKKRKGYHEEAPPHQATTILPSVLANSVIHYFLQLFEKCVRVCGLYWNFSSEKRQINFK